MRLNYEILIQNEILALIEAIASPSLLSDVPFSWKWVVFCWYPCASFIVKYFGFQTEVCSFGTAMRGNKWGIFVRSQCRYFSMRKIRWWFQFEGGISIKTRIIIKSQIWSCYRTYEWHVWLREERQADEKHSIIPNENVLHPPPSKSKSSCPTTCNAQSETLLI